MQFESQEQQTYARSTDSREQFDPEGPIYIPDQEPLIGQKLIPESRKRARLWIPIVAICFLVAIWSVLHSPLISLQRQLTTSFTLSSSGDLVVHSETGNVSIHSSDSDTNTIIVKETVTNWGLDQNFSPVTSQQNGNSVMLNNNDSLGLMGSHTTNLDITVPRSMSLNIQNGSGMSNVRDIHGILTLQAGSGNITLSNISGTELEASTGSGNINVSNSAGQMLFSTGSGNVEIDQGQLRGQNSIKTGSGNVDLAGTLDAQGNYAIQTGSGNVAVTLPAATQFQLVPTTSSGHVQNDFVSPAGSTSQPILSITTGSGDITVHRA